MEDEKIGRGDVVLIDMGSYMSGLAVVLDRQASRSCPDVLRVHDCGLTGRAHYISVGWCRRVGPAPPGVVERAEAVHANEERLDAERKAAWERAKENDRRLAAHRQLLTMFGSSDT